MKRLIEWLTREANPQYFILVAFVFASIFTAIMLPIIFSGSILIVVVALLAFSGALVAMILFLQE